jgi:hypothetical protein
MQIRRSSLLLGLVLASCQSPCKCAEPASPRNVVASVSPAAAPSLSAAPPPAPPPPTEPPPPPPEDADGAASPPRQRGSAIDGRGIIEVEQAGKVQRLEGACYDYGQYDLMPGPYAEVLDPDSGSPRFIVSSCGAAGTHFDIVGTALELPGNVKVMSVRFLDPKTGSEWVSSSATLRVDRFGAVGQAVTGTFTAVMSPRLNRPAVSIRGRFELPRAPDRFPP